MEEPISHHRTVFVLDRLQLRTLVFEGLNNASVQIHGLRLSKIFRLRGESLTRATFSVGGLDILSLLGFR